MVESAHDELDVLVKITIFGASGGVGRELVSQAADANHHVRAIVRSAAAAKVDPRAEVIVVDDLTDRDAVAKAIHGAEVVLSAVGLRRTYPNNPWSRVISPADLTSRFVSVLVDTLSRENPSARVIVVSAAGVGDSRSHMSGLVRWMFDHSNVGVAYADLAKMERVLRASPLDWMAVRPVTLANGVKTGRVKIVERYGLMAKIRRSDVAGWMLEQLASSTTTARTPMIAAG